MSTSNCEHFIGMMYQWEDTCIITLRELQQHIEDEKIRYRNFWKYHEPYTLSDYGDRRKSTDLTRFNYCPKCGEKIDWKAIKELSDA